MLAATVFLGYQAKRQVDVVADQLKATSLPKIAVASRRADKARAILEVYNVDGDPIHLLCAWRVNWDGITPFERVREEHFVRGRCSFVSQDRKIRLTDCASKPITIGPGKHVTIDCQLDSAHVSASRYLLAIDLAFPRSKSRYVRAFIPVIVQADGKTHIVRRIDFVYIDSLFIEFPKCFDRADSQ